MLYLKCGIFKIIISLLSLNRTYLCRPNCSLRPDCSSLDRSDYAGPNYSSLFGPSTVHHWSGPVLFITGLLLFWPSSVSGPIYSLGLFCWSGPVLAQLHLVSFSFSVLGRFRPNSSPTSAQASSWPYLSRIPSVGFRNPSLGCSAPQPTQRPPLILSAHHSEIRNSGSSLPCSHAAYFLCLSDCKIRPITDD